MGVVTNAQKRASINKAIAELDDMVDRQKRECDSFYEEFRSIQRDIPPPPYGEEERAFRYEKLRIRHQLFMMQSKLINTYAEVVKLQQEELAQSCEENDAATRETHCSDEPNKR